MGRCLAGLERLEEAEQSLLAGYEVADKVERSRWRPRAARALVAFYAARGNAPEAEKWRGRIQE